MKKFEKVDITNVHTEEALKTIILLYQEREDILVDRINILEEALQTKNESFNELYRLITQAK